MKIYRYMGRKEAEKLFSGKTLYNNKTHENSNTTSKGFCFLGEMTEFSVWNENTNEEVHCSYPPHDCIDFLSGIVTNDILVEFEVSDPSLLTEGIGEYSDPTYLSGYFGTIEITEYSCTNYSMYTLIPVRYGFVNNCGVCNSVEWYAM